MTLTKNAIGNLVNRYKAVLKKCNLLNAFGSLAVASMLVLGIGGTGMAGEDIGLIYGGKSATSTDKWNNPPQSADTHRANIRENNGNVTGGNVIIENGNEKWHIYGASVVAGNASGNSLTMKGGKAERLYGGFVDNTGSATNNSVSVSNGEVFGLVYGGRVVQGSGNAANNMVNIKGGTFRDRVSGGYRDHGSGNAINNIVNIYGGQFTGNVHGGYLNDGTGNANSNTVIVSDGTLSNVSGGYIENNTDTNKSTGNAENNTVIYAGGTINGNLFGGQAPKGTSSGNTLVTIGNRTVGGDVDYFQNYKFKGSPGSPVNFNNGDTLLKVDGKINFGSGAKLEFEDFSFSYNHNVGDYLTLLSAGTITNPDGLTYNSTTIGTTPISITQKSTSDALVYDLYRDGNAFKTKITEVAELVGPDAVLSGNKDKSIWGKDASAANNKLTVTGPSTVTGNVRNFGNYNFVIPGTLNAGGTLLNVTDTVYFVKDAKVDDISILGDRKVNDTFTLMSAKTIDGVLNYNGKEITSTTTNITQISGKDALVYDLYRDGNAFKTKITEVAELVDSDAQLSGAKYKSIWGKDASSTNNTLKVIGASTVNGNVKNFGSYKFEIPAVGFNAGGTLLNVTDTVYFGKDTIVDGISILGDRKVNDTFTLMSAKTIDGVLNYKGEEITSTPITNIKQISGSDALVYDLYRDGNAFKTKITEVAELLGPDAVLSGNKTKSIWGKDASAANNKLAVTGPSTVAGNVRYFGNYNFVIPGSLKDGGTLLSVTGTIELGTGAKVESVSIQGDRAVGDTFTLLSAGTITNPDGLTYNSTTIGTTPISITQKSTSDALVYDLSFDSSKTKLSAKITEVAELLGPDAVLSGNKTKSIWGKDASAANNKLTVTGQSTVAGSIRNFGNYEFEIPESFKAGDSGEALLTADTIAFDGQTKTNAKIVNVEGNRNVGDVFKLLEARQSMINDANLDISATETDDATYKYELYRGAMSLLAKITEIAQRGSDFAPKLSPELESMFSDAFARGEVKPSFAEDYTKPAGVRFLSRAINKDFGNSSNEAAKTVESVAKSAAVAAVPQMAVGANLAGVGAVGQRTTIGQPTGSLQSTSSNSASGLNGGDELSGLSAGGSYDKSGFAMWIMPLWQSNNSFGIKSGKFEMDSHASIGGIAIGADYTFEQALRFGLTFNIGGGYAEGSGDLAKTKNNMNFWGVGAYAGWMCDNFGLTADVNYTSTHNNIRQEVDPSFRLQNMEADVMATAISAGLRAEYKFNTDALDIIPHVGVRYIHLTTYGYDVENAGEAVLEANTTRQNIWTFPIGVQFAKSFNLDNGWYVRPSLDLNVTPAAGDINVKREVRFTGVTASASPETQTMDWITYGGQAGIEFGNDNLKLGLNYNLQAGAHSTNHGVFGTFRYEF